MKVLKRRGTTFFFIWSFFALFSCFIKRFLCSRFLLYIFFLFFRIICKLESLNKFLGVHILKISIRNWWCRRWSWCNFLFGILSSTRLNTIFLLLLIVLLCLITFHLQLLLICDALWIIVIVIVRTSLLRMLDWLMLLIKIALLDLANSFWPQV